MFRNDKSVDIIVKNIARVLFMVAVVFILLKGLTESGSFQSAAEGLQFWLGILFKCGIAYAVNLAIYLVGEIIRCLREIYERL